MRDRMLRTWIAWKYRHCVACFMMATAPALHFLEPLGFPHGLELQLEAFAASLVTCDA